jgi:hypothetical protein
MNRRFAHAQNWSDDRSTFRFPCSATTHTAVQICFVHATCPDVSGRLWTLQQLKEPGQWTAYNGTRTCTAHPHGLGSISICCTVGYMVGAGKRSSAFHLTTDEALTVGYGRVTIIFGVDETPLPNQTGFPFVIIQFPTRSQIKVAEMRLSASPCLSTRTNSLCGLLRLRYRVV